MKIFQNSLNQNQSTTEHGSFKTKLNRSNYFSLVRFNSIAFIFWVQFDSYKNQIEPKFAHP